MHSLFILGNGFDLHHGLPTRYTDFMAFMKQRHPKVARDFIKGGRAVFAALLEPDGSDHRRHFVE